MFCFFGAWTELRVSIILRKLTKKRKKEELRKNGETDRVSVLPERVYEPGEGSFYPEYAV